MPLRLNKIKPVEFDDDFVATPQLTTELKMRLQGVKKFETKDQIQTGIELLSKCFAEEDREKVQEFLEKANVLTLYQLQAYLAYGIDDMDERIEENIREKESGEK